MSVHYNPNISVDTNVADPNDCKACAAGDPYLCDYHQGMVDGVFAVSNQIDRALAEFHAESAEDTEAPQGTEG